MARADSINFDENEAQGDAGRLNNLFRGLRSGRTATLAEDAMRDEDEKVKRDKEDVVSRFRQHGASDPYEDDEEDQAKADPTKDPVAAFRQTRGTMRRSQLTQEVNRAQENPYAGHPSYVQKAAEHKVYAQQRDRRNNTTLQTEYGSASLAQEKTLTQGQAGVDAPNVADPMPAWKWVLLIFFLITLLALLGYGGYNLYNAIQEQRQGM